MEHYWHQRAKCSSCGGYMWTTHSNQSVVCSCGESLLDAGILTGNAVIITDEAEFEQAVKDDLNDQNITVLQAV